VNTSPAIVWLRDDLRLADNPALSAAVERGAPVVLLCLLDEESRGIRSPGSASRWWLHHSLTALERSASELGGALVLRRGGAANEVQRLVDEVGADAVFWNRRYGAGREVDAGLKSSLRARGIEARSFQAGLLFEPWTVQTGGGTPFRVFTPFWKACLDRPEPRTPLPAPATLLSVDGVASDRLDDWELLPTRPDWAEGLRERWEPGEHAAMRTLEDFADDDLAAYRDERDLPAQDATSHLSPHLRFGEISPFQIWDRVRGAAGATTFLRELGWREFNHNILFHQSDLHEVNVQRDFDAFPWHEPEPPVLEAWQRGRTGIPLVDAGMRELWRTGYLHNRVRMVVASFLVKNLLVDWRVGERWFWDTLVDADEANNPSNWQWVAGSGADAAPYFRVFNPVLQAEKFDPHGEYLRRWIPELGTEDYPDPIVDLKESRAEALEAYGHVRRAGRG
jgi:deoxyribodipyrimidine photo-lyase